MLIYSEFKTIVEPEVSGSKLVFFCGTCNEKVKARTKPIKDNAGANFLGYRCSCKTLYLFSDKNGSYYR